MKSRKSTMKQVILFASIILLFPYFSLSQTPHLHVEGEVRIDDLIGSDNRVVYADPQGTLIAGGILGSNILSVKTHNELKNSMPADSLVVVLEGFYTPGDGGGGIFYYDPNSVALDNVGTIVQPNVINDAGRWMRLFQEDINVKWFGAKGDNIHDDTEAIQAAINAVTDHPLSITNVAGSVILPVGFYKTSSSINIIDNNDFDWRRNIHLKGKSNGNANAIGSNIIYHGTIDQPMINLFSRNCLIEGVTFFTSQDNDITTAILIENPTGSGVVPASGNSFKNVVISGNRDLPNDYQYGSIQNGVTVGDGVFGNKELMKFHSCLFDRLDGAGFLVDNFEGQSKAHSFYDCGFIFSKYGIYLNSGSVQTYSCSFGRLDTAIVVNQITDNIVINDTDSELCKYFFVCLGNSNGYFPVSITAGRFGIDPQRTNPFILFNHGGPLTVQNCLFEPYNPNFKIAWGTPGGQNDRITSMFNSFGNGFPNDEPYKPHSNSLWRLNSIGNIGYEAFNSSVALRDEFRANAIGYGDLNLTTLSGISATTVPSNNVRGRFTLSNTMTTVQVDFDHPEEDNNYYLAITQVEYASTTNAAAVGAGVVKHVTKSTTGFTVEFYEANGLGSSGYYDWILIR